VFHVIKSRLIRINPVCPIAIASNLLKGQWHAHLETSVRPLHALHTAVSTAAQLGGGGGGGLGGLGGGGGGLGGLGGGGA
jgi:hypothetical protein